MIIYPLLLLLLSISQILKEIAIKISLWALNASWVIYAEYLNTMSLMDNLAWRISNISED